MTEWRPVVGLEERYKISENGRIRFLVATRKYPVGAIHPGHHLNAAGYPAYTLTVDAPRKQQRFLLHRMVAQAFIPNPNGYPVVRHLDSDNGNFSIGNLAWGTQKDNVADAIALGRWHGPKNKTHCIHGHEYTPENTRRHGSSIVCVACERERGRTRRAKDPEAARIYRQAEYQRRKARRLAG